MRVLFISWLLISSVIYSTMGSYLSDLDRTFNKIEHKIVDFYVTMPETEVSNLIKITQVSSAQVQNGRSKNLPDFKYENAVIVAKYNGKEKTYEKVSFKTGGMYARSHEKVGFNIKLDKKFLGRKNIRLRPDDSDKSHLHSKISCDIANRMGVPSIQASFARLYMNGEYWGLYTLLDAIKPSWIKNTFNPSEKEITTLFQCKDRGMNFKVGSSNKCYNANDDYPKMDVLEEFIKEANKCKTATELEEIMDVEVFLKYMAFEWLIGSSDQFLVNGHNFYLYKRETDGKWLIIEHDYDNTFGTGANASLWMGKGSNQDGSSNKSNNNNRGGMGMNGMIGGSFARTNEPIQYSFADWEMNIPIVNILVHQNKEQFKNIVHEILVSAFNPVLLNEHIDELKEFLIPYVEEDSTPGKDGRLPGRINKKGSKHNTTVSVFKNNIESSLKKWIETKFEVACSNYGFDQEEILTEATKYIPKSFDYEKYSLNDKKKKKDDDDDDEEEEKEKKKQKDEEDKREKEECWSEIQGYSCCKKTCMIIYTDEFGDWGTEDNQWCGISKTICGANTKVPQCYGDYTGEYKCCEACEVVLIDEQGKWGIENFEWCSIKYSCKN